LGMYNTNAILCFAYNKPVALIDTNIARILGRIFSINVVGDLRRNKKLQELSTRLVPRKHFKEFHWALVDLGALVCKPKNPRHDSCPIASLCEFVLEEKPQKEVSSRMEKVT